MPETILDRKPVFTENFGDSPIGKVLEFLIQHPNMEFTITQISDSADVSRTTLWEGKLLEKMANEGLIILVKKIGNAKLFKLNLNSIKIKIFIECYKKLEMK